MAKVEQETGRKPGGKQKRELKGSNKADKIIEALVDSFAEVGSTVKVRLVHTNTSAATAMSSTSVPARRDFEDSDFGKRHRGEHRRKSWLSDIFD